ncbi:hypothetical protein LCGC14_1519830 [marine sediment metagenome]|uniref:Uncharacterized protein n=1 Tax=marine sediment metagenome TaxID=412755 RepID=A0A0F9IYZ8_9ZZZZ
MNKDIKLSRVQKGIKVLIENFITESDKIMEYTKESRYSAVYSILYYFHNRESIAVDGTLYDILLCQSEYNYGSGLYDSITAYLENSGFYLEYEGQGTYNIVKV